MQRLQCGFKKIADADSFFCGGNLKKGERLLPHVYGVEQIVDGDVAVKAQVRVVGVRQVRLRRRVIARVKLGGFTGQNHEIIEA